MTGFLSFSLQIMDWSPLKSLIYITNLLFLRLYKWTIWEASLFTKIQRSEFVTMKWGGKEKDIGAPELTRKIESFNRVSLSFLITD